MDMRIFLEEAAKVRPSKRQLEWFGMESYAFIHFGMNTFTNREWGKGHEDEKLFAPSKLDCDQWVDAIKSAGMKGMVLTAKHHDGFCLWPSKYTEHSVKNAGCNTDVVKMASDACRRGGIKFGFYLSPWDRTSEYYGTDSYNDYFCNQLTELLTEYGDIFYVQFDNACGEGANGKKQKYDFNRYISLIRKYQPNAVIFNDYGPDIRWCGNEAGEARHSEWAVVPSELCHYSEIQSGSGPLCKEGDLSYLYNTNQSLGELYNIMYSKGLTFTPAEINTSIRPGWFWHNEEEPKKLEDLFRIYLASVGANACMHLNIPPTIEGLFDKRDIKRLAELGALIKTEFGTPISVDVKKLDGTYPTQPQYSIELKEKVECKYVILKENIKEGQRIESFQIEAEERDGSRFPIYQGTVVGNKKICVLEDPFHGQNPLTRTIDGSVKKLVVHVTAARSVADIVDIEVY